MVTYDSDAHQDGPREVVDHHWTPDNPDGSGWADVDWVSAVRGSRYHYRHGATKAEALAALPAFYCVVTRLESSQLIPHENRYYIPGPLLGDFLAELSLAGGIEQVWHVEACAAPPPESRAAGAERSDSMEGRGSTPAG